jgi:glycosyltransferase involved in cell wall biosynthesis
MNHEIFPARYQGDWGEWLRRQYRTCLRQATRIIAISETTKNDVMRFYGHPSEKIDVVQPAVDRTLFRPRQSDARFAALDGEPYVLYVGGRGGYKNFGNLLEGFAQSAAKGRLALVVAGPPWRETERAQLARLGLESRARLVAHPSAEQLAQLYSGARAFIYPSLHEGFGIPLLEAMASGTMVLASDIAVFHEVAGPAAVYFDPHQPVDIARALETPLSETARTQLIDHGMRQVARYSWERCAEQTYAVYRKVLESAAS